MNEVVQAPPGASSLLTRWWNSRVGFRFGRELVLMYGLYLFYKVVRLLARSQAEAAFDNAREVVAVERALGLFIEEPLQDLVVSSRGLVRFFNTYYVTAHFSIAVVTLLWLYFFRPDFYVRARRVLLAMTSIALAIHVLYPLAPPRMLPSLGFMDTGRVIGPGAYGSGHVFDGVANQFAAMPSMHFGWAVLVAWAIVRCTRTRWRWIAVAHPVLTFLAIVLTANHFWLDAAVAAVIFVAVLKIDRAWEPAPLLEPAVDRRVDRVTVTV